MTVIFRAGLTMQLLSLAGCARAPRALTEGATWVTREAPPALSATVSHYEQSQQFGLQNDAHGWRATTHYTLRPDVPGPTAGCSFTGWIAGNWAVRGSTIIVTALSRESASLEMHDCPNGAPAREISNPPIFTRAESGFQLNGGTLHLERQFGSDPLYPVTLVRQN